MIGCSFFEDNAFDFVRKEYTDFETDKFGLGGYGNKRIVSQLLDYLGTNNLPDYVIISFSGFDRDEFVIRKQDVEIFPKRNKNRDYDLLNYVWYQSGGYGGNCFFEKDRHIFVPRYRFGYRFLDRIRENLGYILLAQNTLQNLNIPYTFCFYSNQLENFNFVTGEQVMELKSSRKYLPLSKTKKYFPSINLVNFDNFWLYEDEHSKYNGLEEYASDLGADFLQSCNHHPTEEANRIIWQDCFYPRAKKYLE